MLGFVCWIEKTFLRYGAAQSSGTRSCCSFLKPTVWIWEGSIWPLNVLWTYVLNAQISEWTAYSLPVRFTVRTQATSAARYYIWLHPSCNVCKNPIYPEMNLIHVFHILKRGGAATVPGRSRSALKACICDSWDRMAPCINVPNIIFYLSIIALVIGEGGGVVIGDSLDAVTVVSLRSKWGNSLLVFPTRTLFVIRLEVSDSFFSQRLICNIRRPHVSVFLGPPKATIYE